MIYKLNLSKLVLKKHFPKLILWCFLVFVFITSCNIKQQEQKVPDAFIYKSEYNIVIDSGYLPGICIINTSDSLVNLRFSINNMFWFTPAGMLEYIRNIKAESLPDTDSIISKAFQFVVNFTGHKSEIPLPKEYEFSPNVIINSLGYGLCSNRGAVLAIILKELGYQSRCVHLGGHLVSEVFDKNKWKMLDADNNTYFLMDGKIASSDEIAYKSQKCTPVFGKNTMNIFNSLMPQNYISLFTTHDNNVADPWYLENINWENTHFTLPAHTEFELPAYNPCAENNTPYLFARLKLHRPYKGFLNIPFVIHSVMGNGYILNLHAADEKRNHRHFTAPGNYLILSDSIDIYVYINPFLFNNITGTAKIEFVSNKENSLRLEPRPYKYDYTPYFGSKKFENMLEKKIELYKQAFTTKPEYYFDTISFTSVEQLKELTLTFYNNTRNIQKTPDSIENKINDAVEILKHNGFESTKAFKKLRSPFYRNMILMMLIEFPAEEFKSTFDFYYK